MQWLCVQCAVEALTLCVHVCRVCRVATLLPADGLAVDASEAWTAPCPALLLAVAVIQRDTVDCVRGVCSSHLHGERSMVTGREWLWIVMAPRWRLQTALAGLQFGRHCEVRKETRLAGAKDGRRAWAKKARPAFEAAAAASSLDQVADTSWGTQHIHTDMHTLSAHADRSCEFPVDFDDATDEERRSKVSVVSASSARRSSTCLPIPTCTVSACRSLSRAGI